MRIRKWLRFGPTLINMHAQKSCNNREIETHAFPIWSVAAKAEEATCQEGLTGHMTTLYFIFSYWPHTHIHTHKPPHTHTHTHTMHMQCTSGTAVNGNQKVAADVEPSFIHMLANCTDHALQHMSTLEFGVFARGNI